MSVTAIITALTGLGQMGATIGAGIAGARETERYNIESRRLAEQARQDQLARERREYGLALRSTALGRQGLEFQKEEAGLARQERAEERSYSRLQNAANKAADILNNKELLKKSRLSPLMRR